MPMTAPKQSRLALKRRLGEECRSALPIARRDMRGFAAAVLLIGAVVDPKEVKALDCTPRTDCKIVNESFP
jgi:hypothetical protein